MYDVDEAYEDRTHLSDDDDGTPRFGNEMGEHESLTEIDECIRCLQSEAADYLDKHDGLCQECYNEDPLDAHWREKESDHQTHDADFID